MRVVKPLINAAMFAVLVAAFLVLLAPVYAPVLALNLLLFAVAAVLVFGDWGRKLMALALVAIAGIVTVAIPFLQGDRTVFIVDCPDRSPACAQLHSVRFHEERGVVVAYPDRVRTGIASVFARDTSLVFRIEPVATREGFVLAAPSERRLFALAAAGDPPILSYRLNLGVAETWTMDLRRMTPEEIAATANEPSRTLESSLETGVASLGLTVEAPGTAADEGLFSVRTREAPGVGAYRDLLLNELTHRSILSGTTRAQTLAERARDGGLPLQLVEIEALARTRMGALLTPGLQARLARLCQSQAMLGERPLLSLAQADMLGRVIARGNRPDADSSTAPSADLLDATAVRFCNGFASDIARAQNALARPLSTAPDWRVAIDAAGEQLADGRTAMADALAAMPGSNAQKAYLACTLVQSRARTSGVDAVRRMLAGDFGSNGPDNTGAPGAPDLAQAMRLSLGVAFGAQGEATRAAREECDHWVETLGPFDALSASLIEPNLPDPALIEATTDALLERLATRFALLSAQAGSSPDAAAPNLVEMVGGLFDAPAIRDDRLAGWTPDQRLSREQAVALIGDRGNFPVAVLLSSQRLPGQLGAGVTQADRASAETADHNAREVVAAAATRALDINMTSLVYALKLGVTGEPDPILSRRFADEIGGDPAWACLVLEERGDGALCGKRPPPSPR
jgi:hypothetical protein